MSINAGITRTLVAVAVGLSLVACSSTVTRPEGARVAASAPKYGATTLVQRGDTLYRIASNNGITLGDLAAWNGIAAPYTIYPGQRLSLYPKSDRGSGQAATRSASATARRPANESRPAATPASPKPVAAPLRSGFAWRWPADGSLLSRFVAGEPTKQGIDIGGAGGAPVRAAADGVVVYSGAGLVGYGELIIVKHNEQWLSAYGHNRKRLVNEGQLVKSGEQIAELGRTGAPRDMLHFEVRYNGKPVDPLQHLPPR